MTREEWIEKARREGFENDRGFDPDMFAAWDAFDAGYEAAKEEEQKAKPHDPEDWSVIDNRICGDRTEL